MQQEIERWYRKIWETKGARFIASERYKSHNKLSTLTISLVTAYIIIINLLVILPKRPLFLSDELITFTTISLSLIAFVVTIFLSSREYKYLSRKFHNCGLELTKLYDEVCFLRNNPTTVTRVILDDLSNRYHGILSKYDINHSELDFKIFKRNNIHDYIENTSGNKKIGVLWKRLVFSIRSSAKYIFETYLVYWVFISSPILVYYFVNNWVN